MMARSELEVAGAAVWVGRSIAAMVGTRLTTVTRSASIELEDFARVKIGEHVWDEP